MLITSASTKSESPLFHQQRNPRKKVTRRAKMSRRKRGMENAIGTKEHLHKLPPSQMTQRIRPQPRQLRPMNQHGRKGNGRVFASTILLPTLKSKMILHLVLVARIVVSFIDYHLMKKKKSALPRRLVTLRDYHPSRRRHWLPR